MRILICDSNVSETEKLQEYIFEYFKLKNCVVPEIAIYFDGKSLLNDSGIKDIVFLDICMPGDDGMTAIKELKKYNKFIIVFVIASHYDYLDVSMRQKIFRYFLKPVEKLRLFSALDEATYLFSSTVIKVPIETKKGIFIVNSSDIVMIEADNRKTYIQTLTQKYETNRSIQYWNEKLSFINFFRSHKSFIINMEYVSNFDKMLIHLCEDKYSAYLTRRKYTEFKENYLLYLSSRESLTPQP